MKRLIGILTLLSFVFLICFSMFMWMITSGIPDYISSSVSIITALVAGKIISICTLEGKK